MEPSKEALEISSEWFPYDDDKRDEMALALDAFAARAVAAERERCAKWVVKAGNPDVVHHGHWCVSLLTAIRSGSQP